MIGNAEEFNQALGIPYRIVNIVSGKQCYKNVYFLCKLSRQLLKSFLWSCYQLVEGEGDGVWIDRTGSN